MLVADGRQHNASRVARPLGLQRVEFTLQLADGLGDRLRFAAGTRGIHLKRHPVLIQRLPWRRFTRGLRRVRQHPGDSLEITDETIHALRQHGHGAGLVITGDAGDAPQLPQRQQDGEKLGGVAVVERETFAGPVAQRLHPRGHARAKMRALDHLGTAARDRTRRIVEQPAR